MVSRALLSREELDSRRQSPKETRSTDYMLMLGGVFVPGLQVASFSYSKVSCSACSRTFGQQSGFRSEGVNDAPDVLPRWSVSISICSWVSLGMSIPQKNSTPLSKLQLPKACDARPPKSLTSLTCRCHLR